MVNLNKAYMCRDSFLITHTQLHIIFHKPIRIYMGSVHVILFLVSWAHMGAIGCTGLINLSSTRTLKQTKNKCFKNSIIVLVKFEPIVTCLIGVRTLLLLLSIWDEV